jgi:predicted HTH domain antitoxin
MSSTITIEIPREVIHATKMTPQELRRELALYLFQRVGGKNRAEGYRGVIRMVAAVLR